MTEKSKRVQWSGKETNTAFNLDISQMSGGVLEKVNDIKIAEELVKAECFDQVIQKDPVKSRANMG